MNKSELVSYLERMDRALERPATLYIYGSAACILLDEPDRTSLDIDVAGPYSQADEADVRQAAEVAGVPVNPGDDYDGDHIEWIGPLRLCLQPPVAGTELALYQAKSRAFHTVSFLRNLRKALGRGSLPETEVPGNLVRDIGLPCLSRT